MTDRTNLWDMGRHHRLANGQWRTVDVASVR